MLQALQRNSNVQELAFKDIEFSNNILEGIVSFFGGEPSITDLSLIDCAADNSAARTIASGLLRNNHRIQSLNLRECEPSILCPIFQSLASSNNASRLKTHIFDPSSEDWSAEELQSVSEGLQSYLESADATIQCLELDGFRCGQHAGLFPILRGLSRNTSVTDLALRHWFDLGATEERKQELTNLFREIMAALKTLRIGCRSNCEFAGESIPTAIAEVLNQRKSNLRCLEFGSIHVPIPRYQSLLAAASRSVQLQRLCIGCEYVRFGSPHFNRYVDAILAAVQSFKGSELALNFSAQHRQDFKERLLEALKRNYSFQSIVFKFRTGSDVYGRDLYTERRDVFTLASDAQLEFYLNRNRMLAQWTKNPKLVPHELWSYALDLALKAGIKPSFESLLALSGHGVGVRKQGRSRKRPSA